MFEFLRLNTKIEERNLEIKDLVADLSDGVSDRFWTRIVMKHMLTRDAHRSCSFICWNASHTNHSVDMHQNQSFESKDSKMPIWHSTLSNPGVFR